MNLIHFLQRFLPTIKTLITIIITLMLIYVLIKERALLTQAISMSRVEFFIISIFTLLSWLVTTTTHLLILRALNNPVKFFHLFAIHIGSGLLNHLPLKAGTAYRALMLKRQTSLIYAHFGSFMIINAAILVLTAGLVGTVALAMTYGLDKHSYQLIASMSAMIVVGTIPLLVPLPKLNGQGQIVRGWNNLRIGRELIVQHRSLILVLIICHLLTFTFAALRFMGALSSLELSASFNGVLFMGCTTVLIQLISITPAGLGIREFVVGASGTIIGIPLGTGIIVIITVRAVITLWYFLIGVPALLWVRSKGLKFNNH